MNDTGTFTAGARAQEVTLEKHVHHITMLWPELEQLVASEDHTEREGGKPGKRHVFPAPWHTPAGHLVTTIHAGVREHELNVCLLMKFTAVYRGDSTANTGQALRRLPGLIEHAIREGHGDHQYIVDAARDLRTWPTLMRQILGHEPEPHDPQPWTRAPGNLSCPHCNRRLWLKPGWQYEGDRAALYCRHCRDDHNDLLSWPADAWLAVLQHAD